MPPVYALLAFSDETAGSNILWPSITKTLPLIVVSKSFLREWSLESLMFVAFVPWVVELIPAVPMTENDFCGLFPKH